MKIAWRRSRHRRSARSSRDLRALAEICGHGQDAHFFEIGPEDMLFTSCHRFDRCSTASRLRGGTRSSTVRLGAGPLSITGAIPLGTGIDHMLELGYRDRPNGSTTSSTSPGSSSGRRRFEELDATVVDERLLDLPFHASEESDQQINEYQPAHRASREVSLISSLRYFDLAIGFSARSSFA